MALFLADLSQAAWTHFCPPVLLIAVASTFLGLFIAVAVSEVFEAQTFSNFFRFPMMFPVRPVFSRRQAAAHPAAPLLCPAADLWRGHPALGFRGPAPTAPCARFRHAAAVLQPAVLDKPAQHPEALDCLSARHRRVRPTTVVPNGMFGQAAPTPITAAATTLGVDNRMIETIYRHISIWRPRCVNS
jgi:hypothetical protein